MKKTITTILMILCLLIVLTACDTNVNDTDIIDQESSDIVQIGENYVKALLDKKYEEAYNNYPHDKAMAEVMSPKAYEQTMASIKEQVGEILKIYPSIKSEVEEYVLVSVPIEGEKSNINLNIYFDKNNKIAGLRIAAFNIGDQDKEESLSDDIIEKSIVLNSDGYKLDGVLTLPKEGDDFPIVIIVGGSGPTDKDGTIGANKVYRNISLQLANQGIATYRYDKRTYSYGTEISKNVNFTIFDEYITDIISATKLMTDLKEIDRDNVYILGHSLGGHVIPLISENVDVNGYIIMAGSVSRLEELITKQYDYLFNLDGQISDDEQKILNDHYAGLEKLSNLDDIRDDVIIIGAYKAYWESLRNYSPLESAKTIDSSVLVLQGKRDYQVTMDEYELWYNEFSNYENWSFKTYENLNHLMIAGAGIPSPEEYSIEGDIDEKVIKDITNWITNK